MISKVKPLVHDSNEKSDWFETWFNSPYYHILYKNRDETEAEVFLDSLLRLINPKINARILDVACGKGRHSIFLNKKGYDVSGFDLSESNISYNKNFENNRLEFYLHDMREVFRANYFDIVLNLFSSFGYFLNERENLRCLYANAIALKQGGTFVFDYFNAALIRETGNSKTDCSIDGIDFQIEKNIKGKYISKKIHINEKGKESIFEEMLLLAGYAEFEEYFRLAGLKINHCFGSYSLEPFDAKSSERLIILATKQ